MSDSAGIVNSVCTTLYKLSLAYRFGFKSINEALTLSTFVLLHNNTTDILEKRQSINWIELVYVTWTGSLSFDLKNSEWNTLDMYGCFQPNEMSDLKTFEKIGNFPTTLMGMSSTWSRFCLSSQREAVTQKCLTIKIELLNRTICIDFPSS